MADTIQRRLRVPAADAGRRLDQYLVELFPDFSRARLQQWVKSGEIRVNGARAKPGYRLSGMEAIEVDATAQADTGVAAQAIALDILHQDEQVIVLAKPAGLVVHPAAGNRDGTLQNALLHHDPELARVPRAGIVHRLDKLTSGALVVARTLAAHKSLIEQMQARRVSRVYRALVYGAMVSGGSVDAPLGRHPKDRKRIAVRSGGKPAITHYRLRRRFAHLTDLEVVLETGRTHQIRVHLAHIGHPLVGDPVYGRRLRLPPGAGEPLRAALQQFRRQALHAAVLGFEHPASGREVRFEAPLPADMKALIEALESDAGQTAADHS